MATLTIDRRSGKVVGYNVQWYEGKRRNTIHISARNYHRKTAEKFKDLLETLLYYRKNGTVVPDKTVSNRLADMPVELQSKLANAGLICVTKSKTCQELWDSFLKHKAMVIKEKSLNLYQRNREIFFTTFPPNKPIEQITIDDLLEWKSTLLARYATSSVTGYIGVAKMVFGWAVDQDWLRKNPMEKIPTGNFRNRDKDRFITMEEYGLLLDACPTQEWRVVVALARIGGLRCPSELKQLRWADVDWEKNRFLVRSPKTERHVNHATRLVPLFDELKVELQNHFSDNENEFVVQTYQDTNWSLSNSFQKISERAGLKTIVRPFDNMRMSRANEVVRRWGETKESLWIGHTADVMEKHYLCPLDADFVAG